MLDALFSVSCGFVLTDFVELSHAQLVILEAQSVRSPIASFVLAPVAADNLILDLGIVTRNLAIIDNSQTVTIKITSGVEGE